jgi:23S rRNA pseudouridine1911/1915/1917 synthase
MKRKGWPETATPTFLRNVSEQEPSEIETRSLTVSPSDAGKRLDAYLVANIPAWSRARLQRLIEDQDVLLNGGPAKSGSKLKAGDQIEVDLISTDLESFAPEEIALDIVYEDEYLVVVNKPAGLVVHPAAGLHSGTLANALAYHFEQLSQRAGTIRPGIVHRLDKDTSGLMVVAKTEEVHEHLANQFRAREVSKVYVALVHGIVTSDMGRIDQPVGRDPRNRTRMAVTKGREALTLYRVRQRFDAFTLLEVELKTGRTHQIRVHLAWLKHPVVGDETYGGGRDNTIRKPETRNAIKKLGRHFLHAEQLGFVHPKSGQQLRFICQLPSELKQLLAVLQEN